MPKIEALFQQMGAALKNVGKTCFQKIKALSHLNHTLGAGLLCLAHSVLLVHSLLPPNLKTPPCDIISFTLTLFTILLQSMLLGNQNIPCDDGAVVGASDASATTFGFAVKPTFSTRAVRKAPSSNASTVSSSTHASKEPAKAPGDASGPSPIQFGSIRPDVFNEMRGAGLENLGHTCYLNAVLQCFTHTALLVQSILSGNNHETPCDGYKQDDFCVACHFLNHIIASLKSVGRVISPLALVDNLTYFSSSFKRFRQEDAHEFMHAFLDKLDCCYQDSKPYVSPVQQIFGGSTVSKLRCCECKNISEAYERWMDLSLGIEDAESLGTALESFTKIEEIEGAKCSKCMKDVTAEKRLQLKETPSVAIFHLKRFMNDGSYVKKIDKHVVFPLELDMWPYISGNHNDDIELKYDLYAILVHEGSSLTFGHYYCFIRSAPGTWYKFNDATVTKVEEGEVLGQKAYILFYAKQGTPYISSTDPDSVLDNMNSSCTSSQRVASSESCGTSDQAKDCYMEIKHNDYQPGRRANDRDIHKVKAAPEMKYKKPVPTIPKPFRLRTAERCSKRNNSPKEPVKETNLKQKREVGLKSSIAKKKVPWKI